MTEVNRHFATLLEVLNGEPRSIPHVVIKRCRQTLTVRKNRSVTPADLFPVIEIRLTIPSISGTNVTEKTTFTEFKNKLIRQAGDRTSELFRLLQRLGLYRLTIEIREWQRGLAVKHRKEFQLRQSLKKRRRTKAA